MRGIVREPAGAPAEATPGSDGQQQVVVAKTPKSKGPFRRALAIGFKLVALIVALVLLWLIAVWPPPIWYRWYWPGETAFMRLRASEAAELAGHPARRRDAVDGALPRLYHPVPLADLPRSLQTAALVAEDHRFYEHGGVDYLAILEAIGYRRDGFSIGDPRDRAELMRALDRVWSRRDRVRGASTITQQLAKNLYLSPSRNPLRKVKEAATAYRLEWALGKNRILELYLNVVELGPEVWGAEAASQLYFGRPARRISAEQAAALAGSLPFPLRSNPGYRPGRMRWRQQLILRRMRGESIRVPADDETVDPAETPDR